MSRRNWIVLLVVACVLALAGLGTRWFFAHFERRDTTVTLPDRGEALEDRFYVLRSILVHAGVPAVRAHRTLALRSSLHPHDTLVLGPGAERIGPDAARALAAWVHRGGHLVLAPRPWRIVVASPLFAALGLDGLLRGKSGCADVGAEAGDDASLRLCGQRFMPPAGMPMLAALGDPDDGYAYARFGVGRGAVSLLDDLGPLSGHAPLKPLPRRFALGVLQVASATGRFHFAYRLDGPSFWAVLFGRGWPALLALTLLLLGWAWATAQRLGPVQPPMAAARRALLEHVRAAGEFLYRRDGGRSLHGLAREAVLQRLVRRDPALAGLHGEALYTRLASRSGLDEASVARALTTPQGAVAFREAVVALALLARLGRS